MSPVVNTNRIAYLNALKEEDSLFTERTPRYDFAVLYSGGLDSGAALADGVLFMRKEGHTNIRVLCLNYDFGQSNRPGESKGGKRFIKSLMANMPGLKVDVESFKLPIYKPVFTRFKLKKTVSLFGPAADVSGDIYPMRNFLLTNAAMATCQLLQIPELRVGIGYSDSGGRRKLSYSIWDTSMMAVLAMQQTAALHHASVTGHYCMTDDNRVGSVKLVSPMYGRSKPAWTRKVESELKRAFGDGASLRLTHSCRHSSDRACGRCPSCQDRYKAFPKWKAMET